MKKKAKRQSMDLAAFRISPRDRDLWELAATREEVSLSEFCRKAVRDRARKVLLAFETAGDVE